MGFEKEIHPLDLANSTTSRISGIVMRLAGGATVFGILNRKLGLRWCEVMASVGSWHLEH